VIDIMRTRPMIIIGVILQEDAFFVPPEEFAPGLRERLARLASIAGFRTAVFLFVITTDTSFAGALC